MVVSALSTTGFWSANWPTMLFKLSAAAMMSPVWSLTWLVNVSSCSIRLRRSSSRPANAVLSAAVMS